jgi:hypothetical protein
MMSNAEAAIKRMQLERLILMALQRFEQQTMRKVDRVEIVGGDVKSFAGEEQHVLTACQVVVRV